MTSKLFTRIIFYLESIFDRWKYRNQNDRPIRIQPFRGFGTDHSFYLRGRVLDDFPVGPTKPGDSLLSILLNSLRRFESDEVPYARVKVIFAGIEVETVADEEGYFEAWLNAPLPATPVTDKNLQACQPVVVELIEPIRPGHSPVVTDGQVCTPLPGHRFGIISDIDDTVIQTNVLNQWKMIFTLLLRSSMTRHPFPGMAAFYRGLWRCQPDDPPNPFFYVSTSPWNFYDLLEEYLAYQKFPPDPVMYLRDWGITQDELLPTQHAKHKLRFIKQVMQMYPQTRFILIGDSGQQDPEIYTQLVERYSAQILAIYIRDVNQNPKRTESIRVLNERIAVKGVPLILAASTLPMAEHAAAQGWISSQALEEVRLSFRGS